MVKENPALTQKSIVIFFHFGTERFKGCLGGKSNYMATMQKA